MHQVRISENDVKNVTDIRAGCFSPESFKKHLLKSLLCTMRCHALCPYAIESSHQPHEADKPITPILQMRTERLREVKYLIPGP